MTMTSIFPLRTSPSNRCMAGRSVSPPETPRSSYLERTSPAGVRLASDIGLRGIILGIEGIEVLFQPLVGGDAGIDRTSHHLDRLGVQDRASFKDLSRRPKNRGPFQRVPVMAKAMFDRLG